MDKYQEALDKTSSRIALGKRDYHIGILQELVDKEKPMKVKISKDKYNTFAYCPKCHIGSRYLDNRYCPYCGQRLSI